MPSLSAIMFSFEHTLEQSRVFKHYQCKALASCTTISVTICPCNIQSGEIWYYKISQFLWYLEEGSKCYHSKLQVKDFELLYTFVSQYSLFKTWHLRSFLLSKGVMAASSYIWKTQWNLTSKWPRDRTGLFKKNFHFYSNPRKSLRMGKK